MGWYFSHIQAYDIDAEKPDWVDVTGTHVGDHYGIDVYLIGGAGSLSVDLEAYELGGNDSVSNFPNKMLGTSTDTRRSCGRAVPQDITYQELLSVDDVIVLEDGEPMALADVEALFSHDFRDTYTLRAGHILTIIPKIVEDIDEIKIIKETGYPLQFIDDDIQITMFIGDPTAQPIEGTESAYKHILKDELVTLLISNISAVNDVMIGDIWLKRFFNRRVFLEGGTDGGMPVTAPEPEPLNVQPLEELILEDIVSATDGDGELAPSELASLFDKHIETSGYSLAENDALTLKLKKAFRFKEFEIYIADQGIGYLADFSKITNVRPQVKFQQFRQNTTPLEYNYNTNPLMIDAEADTIIIQNNNRVMALSEIIVKLFLDRRTFMQGGADGSESKPVNVEQHQTLVAEDIVCIDLFYWLDDQWVLQDPLTRPQIASLFDKDPTTGFAPAGIPRFDIQLKTPFRIKEAEITGWESFPSGNDYRVETVDFYPSLTPTDLTPQLNKQIGTIDAQINMLSIRAHPDFTEQVIKEIIIKKFHDQRVYMQSGADGSEAKPVIQEELGELTYQDVVGVTIDGVFITDAELRALFDKTNTTVFITVPADSFLEVVLKRPRRISDAELFGRNVIDPTHIQFAILNTFDWYIGGYDGDSYTKLNEMVAQFRSENDLLTSVNNGGANGETSVYVYQIVIKKYFDQQIINQEANPVNVQELGQLVYDDIDDMYLTDNEEIPTVRHLEDYEIRALLSKHKGTLKITIPVGSSLITVLKNAFDLKRLKYLEESNQYISGTYEITYTNPNPTVSTPQTTLPAVIDGEVIRFEIKNTAIETPSIDVYKILATITHAREVFPQGVGVVANDHFTYQNSDPLGTEVDVGVILPVKGDAGALYTVSFSNPSTITGLDVYFLNGWTDDNAVTHYSEQTVFHVPVNVTIEGDVSVVVQGWYSDGTIPARIKIVNDTVLGVADGFTGRVQVRKE